MMFENDLYFAQKVLNAAPVMVVLLDPHGSIQYINPCFEQLTGWRLNEVQGQDWFPTFLPVRDRDRIRALFNVAKLDIPTRGNINSIVTKSGEEREIEWNDQAIRNAEGHITSLLAIGIDVTERRRAEMELRRTRDRLDAMLQALPDLLFEVDESGCIVDYRAHQTQLLAAPPALFLGKNFADMLPSSAAEICREAIDEAQKSGQGYSRPYKLDLRDGEHWFELSVARKRKTDNDVTTFVLLSREVTSRVRAVQGVQESEERYRRLVEESPICIHELDQEGQILYMNRAGLQLMNETDESKIIGRRFTDFVAESDRARVAALIRKVSNGEKSDFEFTTVNGQVAASKLILLSSGRLLGQILNVTADRQQADELSKSEREFRAIFEQTAVGMFSGTTDGRIERVNKRLCEMLGYSAKEIKALGPVVVSHPDDLDQDIALFAKLVAGDVPYYQLEKRYIHKDGRVIWGHLTLTSLSENGRVAKLFGVIQDITERKQIQNALIRSEEQLRFALKAAGQGFYDLDLKTGTATVSPEYATMIGHNPATFRETNAAWAERIHPGERAKVYGIYESYVRGELPHYEVEFRQRTRDGGWLWTLSIGSIVSRDASGKPLRMLGTHTNIDARKRSQVALAENERLLQSIVEGTFDGILVADLETHRLTFANSAMCRMLGITKEELLTLRIEDISTTESLPATLTLLQSVSCDTPVIVNDLELRRRNGSRLQMDASGSEIELDGRSCTICIFRDVTYRKQQEVALRESEERYRTIFDSAPDAVFLFSAEGDDVGKIVAANEQAGRMQGCSPGELEGQSIMELDTAESAAMFADRLKRVIAGERLTFEVEHFRQDRTIFPVEVTARKVMVGGRQCVLSFDRDISDRKIAKAALRDERDRLRRILDALNAFVAVMTLDGVVTEVNQLPLHLMGVSLEEVRGHNFWELGWLEPSFSSQVQSAIAVAGRGEVVRRDVIANFPKIGRREVDATFSPIKALEGRVHSIVAFGLDITDRKLSELNSARLASIVTSSEDAIISKTLEGVITSWNQSAQDLFGYAETEVIGTPMTRLIPVDRLQEESAIMRQICRGDRVRQFETVRLKRCGTPIDVSATISPIRDTTGKIIGVSTIIRDISIRKLAEASLRRSEARLKQAQRIANIGSWELDFSSDSLIWSDELYRIFEVDPKHYSPSYQDFLKAVHPEDRAKVNAAFTKSVEERQPYDIVHRLQFADGRIKFLRERCETVYDNQGKPILSSGTTQDITDRIQAEQTLRTSETRLRQAHRVASLGVWEFDFASHSLWWCTEQYRLNGVEPNKPVTQAYFLSLIHPDDRTAFDKAFDTLRTQGSVEVDYRIVRPDGQVRFMRGLATMMFDDGGRPIRMHGTNQDVTERVLAEIHRQEIDNRLRLVLDNINEGFFILDRDWRYVQINRAGADLVGRNPEQLIGHRYLDEFSEASGTIWQRTYARVMQSGKAETVEAFYEPLSKWFEARVNPFGLGISVFFADITARKQAELETQELRDALARVNRIGTLNELASGLAHELNQPLSGITFDAETAQFLAHEKGIDSSDLHECLQRIGVQAFRAGEIVRRMRTFIRHHACRQTTHDVNSLIQEVLGLLKGQLYQHAVTIELKLGESLPNALIDGIQIQQVLVNLIRNADDAMDSNGAIPRVLEIRTAMVTDEIRVSVIDNGCGLDPTVAAKLFFPFHTTKAAGLGLGLVTCRTIIEAHGGRIDAYPNRSRGMTFVFTVPVAS